MSVSTQPCSKRRLGAARQSRDSQATTGETTNVWEEAILNSRLSRTEEEWRCCVKINRRGRPWFKYREEESRYWRDSTG